MAESDGDDWSGGEGMDWSVSRQLREQKGYLEVPPVWYNFRLQESQVGW